jgi:hypothetical protein
MLSYVSGEKGKERSDRELVTPWFKFLWETYRTVLEILRNNSKLEALYAVISTLNIKLPGSMPGLFISPASISIKFQYDACMEHLMT